MNPKGAAYLEALLQNDERVLKQLYDELIPSITSYILDHNGTEADARDMFQEALLAVFQKAKAQQLTINSGFEGYLFGVCRNLWLMQLRKKQRQRVTNMDDRQHDTGTDSFREAEETANRYARQRLVEEQFAGLGEGCRKLLKLAWSGRPLEEVARLLNNTYAYIRKKKSECMGKLAMLVKSTEEYRQLKW